MDNLTDRLRRYYGSARQHASHAADVDSAELLERVHAGAHRRQQRRKAAITGAAGVAVAVIAGGVGIGVIGALDDEGGQATSTALEDEANSDGAGDAPAEGPAPEGSAPEGSDAEEPDVMHDQDARGTGLPEGFAATSVTALPGSTLWVLGEGAEPALGVSDDGGDTFQTNSLPDAPLATGDDETGPDTISEVRFADDANGWLYGEALYSTHSGGLAWTAIDDIGRVTHLETTGEYVFALATDGVTWSLWRSPTDSDDWQQLDVELDEPNDLAVSSALILVADSDGSQSAVRASTDDGGSFSTEPSSCSPDLDAGQLSVAEGTAWLSCPTGMMANVLVSTDGGASWSDVDTGEQAPANSTVIDARDASSAIVATPDTAVEARPSGAAEPVDVPSLTQPRSVEVVGEFGLLLDGDLLFRTVDGGASWHEVPFD